MMTNVAFYSKIGISAQEHDQFVKQHQQVNLLQSSSWAAVKNQWQNERIGIFQGDNQVASMSLLIKPLPFGMTMIYIPRGPVMDYTNADLVAFTIKTLKAYGKKKRALLIKFDPMILLKQHQLGEKAPDNPKALAIIKHLKQFGAHWTGPTTKLSDTIQPRFQANCYTNADIEASFPKHTKRLMKDARQRGVIAYRGNQSDLHTFADLISLTEKRKGVALRNEAYFRQLMTTYGDNAYLHLAKVNLPEKLKNYELQLKAVEQELAQTQAHQKKRLARLTDQKQSLQRYLSEFKGFLDKYPDEVVIAGILSISYGNTMEMLYAGMNDDFKKFYPQYLLYPKVFMNAYRDDIAWANMGGIDGSFKDGLTAFKSNFSPTIEEFIGEFNLAVSPFYHLANLLYKIRKQLKHRH